MAEAFAALAQRGIQSVVLEGGVGVHAAWDEALVDYVQLYVAPVTLGSDAPPLRLGPCQPSRRLSTRRCRCWDRMC